MKKPIYSNVRVKAENKYLRALQKDFIDSQGRKGDIIMLESVKSGNGSFICAFTKEKNLLVIKEYKFGNDEFMYTFPSGLIEEGTTGKETIKNELQEETGYTTENDIMYLGKVIQNGYMKGYNELYTTNDCYKFGNQATHEGEEIETYEFSIQDFEQMIFSNKIVDPYTISCYLLAKYKTNNFSHI